MIEEEDENPSGDVRMVTVATFANAAMANLAKVELQAEEIPCFLGNENTAMTLWYMQPAVGGVRLLVPEQFVEEAREVLARAVPEDLLLKDGEAGDEERDDDERGDEERETYLICPTCHSTDTEPLTWRWRAAQAMIIVLLAASLTFWGPMLFVGGVGAAVYFMLTKPDYRCLNCRRRWNG